MATRITNLINPTVYGDAVNTEVNTNKDAVWTSGILNVDAELGTGLGAPAQARGTSISLPYFRSVTAADVVGNDVIGDTITATGITQVEVRAGKLFRNFAYGWTDLARYVGFADPAAALVAQGAKNVLTNRQSSLVSILNGLSSGSDIYTDITVTPGNTPATPGATNQLNRTTFLDAKSKKGDMNTQGIVLMHSAVYYALVKADSTNFTPQSEQLPFGTYLGYTVVVDDRMPSEAADTDGTDQHPANYTTAIINQGAFRFATSGVTSAMDTAPLSANGSGSETIVTRRTDIIHPEGFDYTASAYANSDLATTGNWTRSWNAKNIGIELIKHNI